MIAINLVMMDEDEQLYDEICRRLNAESAEDAAVKGDVAGGVMELLGAYTARKSREMDGFSSLGITEELPGAAADAERAAEVWRPEDMDELSYVRRYIRLHLAEELDLPMLASLVRMHPNYLNELFKKEHGITIHRYILASRLERAAYLLETERTSVAEIAKRVGFRSDSYFIRVFKKYHHITPLKYRQQCGKWKGPAKPE